MARIFVEFKVIIEWFCQSFSQEFLQADCLMIKRFYFPTIYVLHACAVNTEQIYLKE